MSEKQQPAEPSRKRREFLKMGGAATAGFLAGSVVQPRATALPPLPENPATPAAMSTRNLGDTGYQTALFSLGGQAAIEQPDNESAAVAIVERALDLGVNYVDTAAAYGGEARWSQRYIGQVMKRRRSQVFLASKTHDRTRDGSLRLLEESLRLLNTDHLDLWQVHNLSRMEQVEQIFAKGGAIEALQQARDQKMVRYLGVTGHADPEVLIAAIQRFPFDTILMALNAADKHHRSFIERLLPMAVEKQMGIIGMKVPARGRILASWAPATGDPSSWAGGSRPGTLAMREALYYVLSLPVSTVIIGCDSVAQLEENVELARRFTPLSESQMATLVARTEPIARQALFFRRA
ncbi:MAG TPA: aldo/keto reductase [Terriglobales bacterium]|nr:aldo/keto reductase [Terriglobales bacterium]